MTLEKTFWLLDVDGVLNADHPGWNRAPLRSRIIDAAGIEHRFRYAPRLINQIRKIHASGLVEIQWATSWVNDGDILDHIWHFPKFKRAFEFCAVGGFKEKTLAARRIIANGQRLVWTDDAVVPKFGDLYDELTKDGRALLISPRMQNGLQPEHIQEIKNFIGMKESPSADQD